MTDEVAPIIVTLTIGTSAETLHEAFEGAAGDTGIRYWGYRVNNGVHSGGFTVRDTQADDEFTVTWEAFAKALGIMAGGYYTRFDGEPGVLSAYHVAGARAALTNDENGDWDADTMDIAMQLAVHGKVVYG